MRQTTDNYGDRPTGAMLDALCVCGHRAGVHHVPPPSPCGRYECSGQRCVDPEMQRRWVAMDVADVLTGAGL